MTDFVSRVPLSLFLLLLAAGTSFTNAHTPILPENVTIPCALRLGLPTTVRSMSLPMLFLF
ncbi:hypothetical protein PVAP13_1KG227205 [Panicum virgatum]|uniref:Uncharacterized protein n=1 Tax=Panicum virgatum TaxID=38727 RepID=A0A8T0X945_PANVG|nr:hypothetical protein PVAP13_1KG227205 [Panicum virgatum]